jgi:hypothetical protein
LKVLLAFPERGLPFELVAAPTFQIIPEESLNGG